MSDLDSASIIKIRESIMDSILSLGDSRWIDIHRNLPEHIRIKYGFGTITSIWLDMRDENIVEIVGNSALCYLYNISEEQMILRVINEV